MRGRGAAVGLTLLGLGLAACEIPKEVNPVVIYREITGLADEGREPPPGLEQPFPNLASVPPRPERPPLQMREAISAGLAADRESARTGPQPPRRGSVFEAVPGEPPIPAAPPSPPNLAGAPPVPWDEPVPAAAVVRPAPAAPRPLPSGAAGAFDAVPPPAMPGRAPAPPPPDLLGPPGLPPPDLLGPPAAPSPDLLGPPPAPSLR